MSRKALIVDDIEKNRRLLRMLMEYSGFEVIEAEEGQTGVRLAKEHKPDIILMDIQMPVMDGVAAMKAIRADPELAAIPIIAVTSYAMQGDMEHFLNEGFNSYIAKPIDTKEFNNRINSVLKTTE